MSLLRDHGPLAALVVTSIGLHAGAFAALPAAEAPRPQPPQLVEMVLVATAEPPAVPPAPIATAPEPEPAPQARRIARTTARPSTPAPRTPRPAPPPPSAEPPPAAEAPADFTGVTLTNDGPGAAWQSPVGNGAQITGAIGRPGGEVTGRRRDGAAAGDGAGSGERVVAAGDLSRAPRPPDLSAALASHYPEAARTSALRGRAKVRVRIHADGRVGALRVLSESAAGFGAACVATLRGSRWQPPLDGSGRAVATDVAYTCEFEVVR